MVIIGLSHCLGILPDIAQLCLVFAYIEAGYAKDFATFITTCLHTYCRYIMASIVMFVNVVLHIDWWMMG